MQAFGKNITVQIYAKIQIIWIFKSQKLQTNFLLDIPCYATNFSYINIRFKYVHT